jgi:uncharacterized pyridoxal phosphate-containing UPF0001 family protein
MTQHEQEAYVRSKWIEVYDCGAYVIIYGTDGRQLVNVSRQTTVEAWQAVYDFTIDREEEIRKVEREASVQAYAISALREQINYWCALLGQVQQAKVKSAIRTLCAMCRTRARLDQKLTELKREMKETT